MERMSEQLAVAAMGLGFVAFIVSPIVHLIMQNAALIAVALR